MNSASDAPERFRFLIDYNPSRLVVPRPSIEGIHAAERFLAKKAQRFEDRDLIDGHEFLAEVLDCLSSNRTPSKKAMRRVAAGNLLAIAAAPNGKAALADFIELLINADSKACFKALLLGFLRMPHGDDTANEGDAVRLALSHGLNGLPQRWKLRIQEYGLLDKPIARLLAKKAMEGMPGRSPLEVFEHAGLRRGVLLGGGFAHAAFRQICDELARGHDDVLIERFFSFFPTDFSDRADERVQLTKTTLGDVARALLTPYLDEDPGEDRKGRILELLLRLYKDPRLNAEQWVGVDGNLIEVLYRWLTSESFEMLMEVLNSSNQSQQWKTRETFWRKYIKKNHVKEAWVAFGPDAERQARLLIRSGQLRSRGAYGVLERSQIQGHHSVLFMRIGDLTISEWTHDGKVRFYRSRNLEKPSLYRLRYDPEVLRRDRYPDFLKVHRGAWQGDVAGFIYQSTGIRQP